MQLSATLLLATLAPFASALPIHETLFHDGAPDAELVRSWSRLRGTRGYLIHVPSPTTSDLAPLAELTNADRLRLEIDSYPAEPELDAWRRLARAGAELVVMGAGLPNEDEIARVDAIGFRAVTLVLTAYPGPEEARRLERLRTPVEITFAAPAFPRFEDRDGLRAVPAAIPLLFISDYWPWYSHMDLFNMLPHAKRVRVRGYFPSEEHLDYLLHIRDLRSVQVETDYDAPEASLWTRLGAIATTWIARDWVPSADGLAAFADSAALGPRALTLDSDWELQPGDRARLERADVPVEWIHR